MDIKIIPPSARLIALKMTTDPKKYLDGYEAYSAEAWRALTGNTISSKTAPVIIAFFDNMRKIVIENIRLMAGDKAVTETEEIAEMLMRLCPAGAVATPIKKPPAES